MSLGPTDRSVGCSGRVERPDAGMEMDDDMEPTYDEGEGLAFETSKGISVLKKFSDMGLRQQVLRGLYQYGFEKPSAIQQRAIVPIAAGRDIIAQAQSGTGKSSMLAIATCQLIDPKMNE